MACRCEEWHGGCAGQDTFAFNEANWYLVDTDTKYFGWIYSWRDMVGLSRLMEDFLHYLFVWPWFPVVWLDNDANRTNAPLFIVARYGRGRQAHTCYFQFGCRYCRRQTEMLFPAADDRSRNHAEQQLKNFFEPLLRQYISQRVLPYQSIPQLSPPLTALSLDLVANRHEVRQPQPPPPPPPPPPLPPPTATGDAKLLSFAVAPMPGTRLAQFGR